MAVHAKYRWMRSPCWKPKPSTPPFFFFFPFASIQLQIKRHHYQNGMILWSGRLKKRSTLQDTFLSLQYTKGTSLCFFWRQTKGGSQSINLHSNSPWSVSKEKPRRLTYEAVMCRMSYSVSVTTWIHRSTWITIVVKLTFQPSPLTDN